MIDDLISRASVIEEIRKLINLLDERGEKDKCKFAKTIMNIVAKFPSAKTDIVRCERCLLRHTEFCSMCLIENGEKYDYAGYKDFCSYAIPKKDDMKCRCIDCAFCDADRLKCNKDNTFISEYDLTRYEQCDYFNHIKA